MSSPESSSALVNGRSSSSSFFTSPVLLLLLIDPLPLPRGPVAAVAAPFSEACFVLGLQTTLSEFSGAGALALMGVERAGLLLPVDAK